MTDTAAFLAGCAVTGVAAIFLLRNDFAISQSRSVQPGASPPVVTQPVPSSPTASGMFQDPQQEWRFQTQLEQQQGLSRDLTDQFRRQQTDTQDLKSQLEKQQNQTEDLRSQLDKQQRNTEQLIAQLQEQQRVIDKVADQRNISPAELRRDGASSEWHMTALWIAGGVVLVILVGGGLIFIGIVAVILFSARQKKTSRTVHVVHPMASPYSFASQPPLLPPSRVRAKPPQPIDYYGE
jgi:hypothetical protein